MPAIYINEPATVEIDPEGVTVIYKSGDVQFKRRMSRKYFRAFLLRNLRDLNAFENNARNNIVPFTGLAEAVRKVG